MQHNVDHIKKIREELYHLNPDHSPEDQRRYKILRAHYISHSEGRSTFAYKDVLGLTTVGIGFNMERKDSRMEWALAFGKNSLVDFDDTYIGCRSLSHEEIETLFKVGLDLREKELQESYCEVWEKLKPNERLATESAYYNGSCLVQGPTPNAVKKQLIIEELIAEDGITRYYTHLARYTHAGHVEDLKEAVIELRDRSNRRGIRGLALRREAEALLLSSFEVKGFSGTS